MIRDFDWNLIKAFLAVADHGTLSAAAGDLRISQPTLGRHITALEDACGFPLFDRGRTGMKLTPGALDLLDEARAMKNEAGRFALAAAGHDEVLEGTVRITASQVVATFVLPPIIAALRTEEPGIRVEIVASNALSNLLARDADIAIRMVRPTQNDVIARKVADFAMGAYATPAYIEAHGEPRTVEDLRRMDVVGYDRETLIIDGMRAVGITATRDDFAVRIDDQVTYWFMVKAGCGIGFGPRFVGDRDPDVVRVLQDYQIPALPMWLASHRDLRTSKRIRRVADFLHAALSALPLSAD